MKVEHDENREQEVQNLCEQVLEMGVKAFSSDYSDDGYTCPYCSEFVSVYNVEYGKKIIEQIPHATDCAYLIAKDLSTGGK